MIVYTFILCLFVSISAIGQTLDPPHNNTTTKWVVHERTSVPDKPLIIVDDVIYDGDLNNINPNIIESIDVHKDESTLATYGPSAVDGVIIVKTKNYQKNDKARSIDSLVSNDALFVIDGELSNNKLNDVDPNNILTINILKKNEGFDSGMIKDVVIVVTELAAIKSYQKKFSAFSKEYKKYLDDNNGCDSRITYFISNGEVLRTDDNKSIRILYEIPQDKIDKVSFSTHKNVEDIRMIMVGIDLKK